MKQYAIGVDIGGTSVKLGLFQTTGESIHHWEIKTRKEENGRYILSDIATSILETIPEYQIQMEDIEGVGVGVPGPILQNGVVNRCVNLGWGVLNVQEELGSLLSISNVKVGNDANVAALGEMWKGGGQGFENLVMVTLGTGVGGGIVLNGKILPGTFGAAGEIGHITVSKKETESCGCGKKGCLEQYASATGIVRKGKEVVATTTKETVLSQLEDMTAKDIFDAAKAGDEVALEIVDFLGENLGMALSFISCVIDPQAFVIGGGVAKAGDILIDTIKKHYGTYAFHASRNTEFRLAKLGNDAGIYGAVKMVL